MAVIPLRYPEYEAIRRVPTHFPISPGHDDPEIERAVEQNERYLVVEKFGEAGITAVELDPRRHEEDATETTEPRWLGKDGAGLPYRDPVQPPPEKARSQQT